MDGDTPRLFAEPVPAVSELPLAAPTYTARPYQVEAIEKAREIIRTIPKVLLVLPTGGGKCVTPDTLVWGRGLRTFGDLWGSDRIAGPHGTAEVSGWYDDGERDGFRVTLECGLTINGTPAHRVWVRDANGFEGWRHVGALRPRDFVGVARGESDFGDAEIPLDEAYALGLFIADGCLTFGTSDRLQIDKQRPVIEAVAPVLTRWVTLAGGAPRAPKIADKSPYHAVGAVRRLGLGAMLAARFGFNPRLESQERVVPDAILRGSRAVVQAFLRGYFDGDGYCDKSAAVSTASPTLARQVEALLLGLGIWCGARTKIVKGGLPAHILNVRDTDTFAREVGFTRYGLTKDIAFDGILSTARNTNVDTVPGVGDLLRRAARYVPQKTRRNDAWRHVDAYYGGTKRPSYATLNELLAGLQACPERTEMERLCRERRAWSAVESVTPSRARRIDCEVPDGHAFVGNGVVNHNTLIAALVIRGAVAKGKRVAFLAHRREIIVQSFWKIVDAGVPESLVGIVMADGQITDRHGRLYDGRRPMAQVQVASVQTLLHRRLPPADVVFVDEAHHATADSYARPLAEWRKQGAVVVGLTATPERADGRGLADVFEHLHMIAQPRELIAGGYLAEPAVWAMQAPAGLDGVKLTAGDYNVEELGEVMDCPAITGSVVEQYITHGGGRTGVVFTVNTKHAAHLAERFREAGIPAEDLNGETPTEVRDAILRRLADGTTTIVCNCGVLTEGWDLPRAKYLALARPTRSLSLYLQMAGRILRPYEGIEPVIVDHGGCVEEHGLPHDDRDWSLEAKKRGKKASKTKPRACPDCERVVPLPLRVCPGCGHAWPALPVPDEMSAEAVRVTRKARIAAADTEAERERLRKAVHRAVTRHAERMSAVTGAPLDLTSRDLNTTLKRRFRAARSEMTAGQLEDALAFVRALPKPEPPPSMPCARCGEPLTGGRCASCACPEPADFTEEDTTPEPVSPPVAEAPPVPPANTCTVCGARWYGGGICRRCARTVDRPGVVPATAPAPVLPAVSAEEVSWQL